MFGINPLFVGSVFFDVGAFTYTGFSIAGGTPSFVYSGAAAVWRLSGWPGLNRFRNYQRALLDWRLSRIGNKSKKREELPHMTDSPNYGERGVGYLREYLGNGNRLPSQTKVLRNVLGPEPEDEKGKEHYRGLKGREIEKDRALRIIVEKIIGKWIEDPIARGEFLRKLNAAHDDALKIRVLLDPKGDGSFLSYLTQLVPGIQNEKDPEVIWQDITRWFVNNFGLDGVVPVANEAASLATSRGPAPETLLTQAIREGYISKLVDSGYMREEADTIVGKIRSEEEAEEIMRYLTRQEDPSSLESTINDTLPRLKKMLGEKGAKGAKKEIERKIEEIETQIKRAKEGRARRFLQDIMKVAKVRFGKTLKDFGYEAGKLPDGVSDVQTAADWFYNKL